MFCSTLTLLVCEGAADTPPASTSAASSYSDSETGEDEQYNVDQAVAMASAAELTADGGPSPVHHAFKLSGDGCSLASMVHEAHGLLVPAEYDDEYDDDAGHRDDGIDDTVDSGAHNLPKAVNWLNCVSFSEQLSNATDWSGTEKSSLVSSLASSKSIPPPLQRPPPPPLHDPFEWEAKQALERAQMVSESTAMRLPENMYTTIHAPEHRC